MMRVFWEEWRLGGTFSSGKLLPLAAWAVAAVLLITQFHPGSLFETLGVLGLVGGLMSGTLRWNRVAPRDWMTQEGISPANYALGKVGGLGALLVVWTAFAFPALLLVTLTWGLPWQVSVAAWSWVLAGALGAQALGHLVTWGQSEVARVVAASLVLSWLVASLQFTPTRALNPLWQIWNLFRDPTQALDFGALALVFGSSALLWVGVVWGLGRQGRPR